MDYLVVRTTTNSVSQHQTMNLSAPQQLPFVQPRRPLSLADWNLGIAKSLNLHVTVRNEMTKTYYFSTHCAVALTLLVDALPDDVLGIENPPPAFPFCKNACIFALCFFFIFLFQSKIFKFNFMKIKYSFYKPVSTNVCMRDSIFGGIRIVLLWLKLTAQYVVAYTALTASILQSFWISNVWNKQNVYHETVHETKK